MNNKIWNNFSYFATGLGLQGDMAAGKYAYMHVYLVY